MCGIIGCKNYPFFIKESLEQLKLRGRDGIGYYKIETYSGKIKLKKFLGVNLKYKDTVNDIFLANSRAIPTTEWQSGAGSNDINQQPFKNDEYVVVHNGIISNDKELRKKYKIKTESVVDSSLLPDLFSKVGVIEGMKEIKGSFSIIAYNMNNDYMYAGSNFMPLVYSIKEDQFICASLKEMLPNLSLNQIKNIQPYTCIKITYKGITFHSLRDIKQNKKVLVICSGGIDSVTTAYIYKRLGYEVTLLHFKYGQAAQESELFAINKISKDLNTKPIIMDAVPIFNIFKESSKLLNQTKANKKEQMIDSETTFSYVPNRNAIFTMIASGIAEMHNISIVSFGGQQMDSVYPDNNPTFVDAINNLLPFSLNWNTDIKFTAPLIHLIKHEIIDLGVKIGVPYEYTCSCYYPKIKNDAIVHCTKCGCCQFRVSAFKMLGLKDKVKYAEKIDLKENMINSSVNDPDEFINKYVRRWC